jgi:hypothetical protein
MNEDDKRMFLALVKGKDIGRVRQSVFTQNIAVFPLVLQVGSNTHNDGAHVRRV